jgi:O-succinylbenzoic acid--CoA ligase
MTELVALDLPGGPQLVDEVRRAWDASRAVLVVDQRLPPGAARALLEAAAPHEIVEPTGRSRPARPACPDLADGDALVAATSGSTGAPKLVVHTRSGLEAHAHAVHERLVVDPSTDRWLVCLPVNHLGGFGVVARSLLTGTACTVLPGFDADAVSGAAAAGCTLTSLVPTVLGRVDLAPFRWVVVGGSADPAERPANVVRTYGLTESGGGVVYDGVPLAGTEVRIAAGAIELRGPSVARGLLGADRAVRPITGDDGWLATGDLGAMVDGRLVVQGRRDDLIISGGENVWPDPVERRLLEHPGVSEAAIVGEPDPEWGQRVVAVVVPADPTVPPSLDELRAHVREILPAAAAPGALRVVTALPRTALGKVRRGDLAEPAAPGGSGD